MKAQDGKTWRHGVRIWGRLPDTLLAECDGADCRWNALDRDQRRAAFPT